MKSVTIATTVLLTAVMAPAAVAEERRPVYGSLYGGGSSFDVDFNFVGNLGFEPEDEGDTFGAGVGYEINDNWFLQLDYTNTDASDVEIQQVFLSLNYQRPLFIPGMQGMVGLVVG
ncbi:MAG: outer membrane beta-barrel protein, partial [Halieaceae bacterium]|nr:outer membrane beta-barrel protein [Halieaceae bacterium]